MDDGMLSQDEIDALLKVSIDEDDEESESVNEQYKLSAIEIDTLGEIGNISIGSSATTLSTLLNQKVEITTPEVSVTSREELNEDYSFDQVNIKVKYVQGLSGQNMLVLKSSDASIIADIMLGGDGTSPPNILDELHLSAVQEVMNQMMGAAATSLSTVFDKRVDISPPSIKFKESKEDIHVEQMTEEEMMVKVLFQLKVGNLIDSNIVQLMPFQFAKQLVAQLLNGTQEETAATLEQTEESKVNESEALEEAYGGQSKDHSAVQKQLNQNNAEQAHHRTEPQFIGNPVQRDNAQVEHAAFSEFTPTHLNQNEQKNLDMLLDIPLKVTVELGRTKRTIKDILDLTSGSIVELDKLAGEPVDILINQKLIAKGEVVVIDENFGVRLTDIISQSDRLKQLK